MRLIKVYAKNYKAFKELELDVSKFNVLIGKNSAGKSAIIRLIPFILRSLYVGPGNILDFSPLDIDMGASFTDIVHGHNEYAQLELGAAFEYDEGFFEFHTEITYSTELKQLVVSKFNSKYDDDEAFEIELDLENLETNNTIRYLSGNKEIAVKFNGLLPLALKVEDVGFKRALRFERFIYHNFNLSYLGPFRTSLLRSYTTKTLKSHNIGDKGQNAPYIFKEVDFKSNGVLSKIIKDWMQQHFDGKHFALKSYGHSFSIVCQNLYNESNIVDEGMGFAQSFPPIINRMVRDLDNIKGIEIIEQPELHMHPAACGLVADLYLKARNENIVFVETHSKEFLLRVRRRVAEGIDCKDINILYIENDNENKCSKLSAIKVDSSGGLEWWPNGIFEEDFEEVIALDKARG